MNTLFEHIENRGLIRNGNANPDAVDAMSIYDILDFSQESKEITLYRDGLVARDLFCHASSESMSAAAWPCEEEGCRLQKAHELAQYAAFYSDKVLIENFITRHLKHLESDIPPNEGVMKNRFYTDIVILQALRPLIEAGLVTPISYGHCCHNCLTTKVLKLESDESIIRAFKSLADRYADEVKYSTSIDDNGLYQIVMTGPEDLLEHGYLAQLSPTPFPCITNDASIRDSVNNGQTVVVPRKWIEDMGFDVFLAKHSFENALFGFKSSQVIGSHFVTDRDLDITLANDITNSQNKKDRNRLVQQHITSLVPFLENLQPQEVLQIRDNDGESFIRFRQALNKAIDECSPHGSDSFTEKDANEVFQDILRPELARLDQITKQAHSSILKGTVRSAASCAAAISFGYITGILPTDLLEAAKTLGLFKVVSDLAHNTLASADSSKDLQASPLYFLWKVQNASRKWDEAVKRTNDI